MPLVQFTLVTLDLDFSKLSRSNLFVAYTCCGIIHKSKTSDKWFSIDMWVNSLAENLRIDKLEVYSILPSELEELQELIIDELYKPATHAAAL